MSDWRPAFSGGARPASTVGRSASATSRSTVSPFPFQGKLRCAGTTKAGNPCSAPTARGTKYCIGHARMNGVIVLGDAE